MDNLSLLQLLLLRFLQACPDIEDIIYVELLRLLEEHNRVIPTTIAQSALRLLCDLTKLLFALQMIESILDIAQECPGVGVAWIDSLRLKQNSPGARKVTLFRESTGRLQQSAHAVALQCVRENLQIESHLIGGRVTILHIFCQGFVENLAETIRQIPHIIAQWNVWLMDHAVQR